MFFTIYFSLLLALSQTSIAQKASATSSSPYPTHTVTVGEHGHVFTPESITANVGDIIEYRFFPLNHSVARAEFKNPCIPYEISGAGKQGFWSNFFPLNVLPSPPPLFQVQVNDTKPIFFYCSAPGACVDGMVGVINPNSTQTLEIQKQFAANSSYEFSPGESFPPEVRPSGINEIPAATQTGSASSSTSTVVAAAHHDGLGAGPIVGIVIGAVAVLVLAGALLYVCGRQRTIGEMFQQQKPHPSPSFLPGPMSMASPSAYQGKSPTSHVTNIGPHAGPTGYYEQPKPENFRTSPERGEFSPPINFGSPPGHNNSTGTFVSPTGHPMPFGSPTSPEDYQRAYQHLSSAEVPIGLRIQRGNSFHGPHELPGNVANHDYVPPYPGNEFPRPDVKPGIVPGGMPPR